MAVPLISCVMPTTAARRWCIPLAIECFQRQSYPSKELVIVGDGNPVGRLVPRGDRQIRYIHLNRTIPLSDKYNACVEFATADWIALWADDDWHAPTRLAQSMEAVREGIDIVGLRKMIFHRLGTDKAWLYERLDDGTPYFLGGSILFHRRYWERHPFPSGKARQADADFTNAISAEEYARVAAVLEDPTIYVAMNHGDNTGRDGDADPAGPGWSAWEGDLDTLMGGDRRQRYVDALNADGVALS